MENQLNVEVDHNSYQYHLSTTLRPQYMFSTVSRHSLVVSFPTIRQKYHKKTYNVVSLALWKGNDQRVTRNSGKHVLWSQGGTEMILV